VTRPGPIAATAIAAIVLRIAYLAALRAHPEFLEPVLDAAANVVWARGWWAGLWPGSEPFFRAPGAIWGIALGLRAAGDDPVRLACAQIVLGGVTPVLAALLARAMFGIRAAWIAGLGAASYPMFPFHDGQLLDSFLQMPVFLGAVLASWHSVSGGRGRSAVIAGVLWGAAAIIRPPLLAGAIVPAVAILCAPAAALARSRGARVRQAVLLLAGALALPLAVTARNAAAGDPLFIASQGGLNLYLGNARGADGVSASFPDDPAALGYAMVESAARIASTREGRALRPSEVSHYWAERTRDEIRADPSAWLRLMRKKALLFWTRREIPNNHDPALFAEMIPWWGALPGWGLWAPFGISGALVLFRDSRSRFLVGIIGAVFATSVAFFVAARFRLPAAPLLIVLAAGGADAALTDLARGRRRSAATFVVCGLALAFASRWNPYRIPERPWVVSSVLVAEAEMNRGELGRALAWIERALAEEPGLYAARRGQIDLLRRMGRFNEGRDAARRLVEVRPDDAAARAELGVLLDLSGDSEGALAELDAALRIDPELEAARVHRAVALARRGDVGRAREELESFLREHPRSAEADRARKVLEAIAQGVFSRTPATIDPPEDVP
jgi:hypothetical protein